MKGLVSCSKALNQWSIAARKLAESLIYLAWAMPGRWPDPFVILKRADRTGVRELPFGGELWGYPRPVLNEPNPSEIH